MKDIKFTKNKNTVKHALQTRFENIPVIIYSDFKDAAIAVANEIAALIKIKQLEGEYCVLGLPTGSTPISVYNELIRMHKEDGLSFSNVVVFNTDEYYPIVKDSLQSFSYFMHENLYKHIDISTENINLIDGSINKDELYKYCKTYEDKIESFGGIDLQLLGIGRTGHIGFNEPGSMKNSITRPVVLDYMTRNDVAAEFHGLENVPRKSITMGVGTILKAKKIILMAHSEQKSKIIKEMVEGQITSKIPATYLQQHENVKVILDNGAAEQLTRIKTPWLVDTVEWNDKLVRKAVVWLCQKVGKPILKLTDRDYNDHGMTELIAEYGPAYNINIKVFNDLQRTITGWPGGKPNADDSNRPERAKPAQKRVVIFSPHPDDDVISMGGTFLRLVEHKHEVHIAYQTSGNIAVTDDYSLRYLDFLKEYQNNFDADNKTMLDKHIEITNFIKNKKPGQLDMPDVRKVKGSIRRGEALDACRYFGVSAENAHFLDLPFYETGAVKKAPIGKADVDIIVNLLQEVKPHQIFAAGDLSDPHGTHRVCLDAIFAAIELLKNEKWMKDCYVWLYRGAWQEWDVDVVEMAVPISPEELMRKRNAIFKHQSQKDGAMFPGADAREFWQRAEDRNRGTAKIYDELGMAEYEAIEAFVRYKF